MNSENPTVLDNGYGIRDSQQTKEIACCDECGGEIYDKGEMYNIEFNNDVIHKDCFDDYFKQFVMEVE